MASEHLYVSEVPKADLTTSHVLPETISRFAPHPIDRN